MPESLLELTELPNSLVDYLAREVNLTWTSALADKRPAWFKHTKALPALRYPEDELMALIRAKQEGWLKLSLDCKSHALWQAQANELKAIGIKSEEQCETNWSSIESIARRQIVHQAKTLAEKRLIEEAAEEFKILINPPLNITGNTLIIEPGLKSGLKLAACDKQHKIICHSILFPHEPQNQWSQSLRKLDNFVASNKIEAVVIATGEGYRESRRFIKCWLKDQTKSIPCYRIRGIGLEQLAENDVESTDTLYSKVDAITRLAIAPLDSLAKVNLKSILSNALLSVVNQQQLNKTLKNSWLELHDVHEDRFLPEDLLFSNSLTDLTDLKVGMKLQGQVINDTEYGYFLDVGIMENGLLHNSKLAKGQKLVVGQILEVSVINISLEKQQYSLGTKIVTTKPKRPAKTTKSRQPGNSAMADALKAAMTKDR